ncbi:uncharacterized protein LOC121374784 [Gigantopelta aegis]|uniref:uncharacterized protein LOC121374784 n=1 Tax=Gigantopelta aegis TaxID=1735272 RepID=UPI001B88745D|nr:uncharacterized protein LOC121374784 [Gigantopelta aegis]
MEVTSDEQSAGVGSIREVSMHNEQNVLHILEEQFRQNINQAATASPDSTQEYLERLKPNVFVETEAAKCAYRYLTGLGMVLIDGQPGGGKTTIGIYLLKEVARRKHKVFLVITEPQQWDYIPVPKDITKAKHKYVVLIDDIFGASNLSVVLRDSWERKFDMMLSLIYSGHVQLVIITRSYILAEASATFIGKFKRVSVTDGPCKLSLREKEMILTWHIRERNLEMSKEDIEEASKSTADLGFPQICKYFVDNKKVQERSLLFVKNPLEYLGEELRLQKSRHPLGYFVLLLVMYKEGKLPRPYLDPSNEEAKTEIDHLKEYCSNMGSVTNADIVATTNNLVGTYLVFSDTSEKYEFIHQSVFDAMIRDFGRQYLPLALKVCTCDMLVDTFTTSTCQGTSTLKIVVDQSHYAELAARITLELLSGNHKVIAEHQSLSDTTFVNFLINEYWDHEAQEKIICHTIGRQSGPFSEEFRMSIWYIKTVKSSMFPVKDIMCELLRMGATINQDNALLQVAGHDHPAALEVILQHTPNLNKTNRGGKTAMHIACEFGAVQNVEILVERRANVRSVDIFGRTPLHYALDDKGEKAALLLGANADVNVVDANGQTPLHAAAIARNNIVITQLLEAGAEPIPQNSHKDTPLHIMLHKFQYERDNDCFADLLQRCSSVDYTDKSGNTPLHLAVRLSSATPVLELIKKGACVDAVNTVGDTPLICLFQNNATVDEETINQRNNDGDSALHCAAYKGCTQKVALLLKYGASFSELNGHDHLPLHCAARGGQWKTIELMLNYDTTMDVNIQTQDGCSPLHLSCAKGHVVTVKKLVEKGADVNLANKNGDGPIHCAAQFGKTAVVATLLSSGADVNMQNNGGETALHVAAKYVKVKVVKLLLQRGIDQSVCNAGDLTAEQMARITSSVFKSISDLKRKTQLTHIHHLLSNSSES